jgi:hypothetical protein
LDPFGVVCPEGAQSGPPVRAGGAKPPPQTKIFSFYMLVKLYYGFNIELLCFLKKKQYKNFKSVKIYYQSIVTN